MFGYVRPSQARLSEEDAGRFRAAYCGLCQTLGKRFGLVSRFILNYDFAFLAILLADGPPPELLHKGCIAHPLRGRNYIPNDAALELCADCSVILAWWQLQDAIADNSFWTGSRYRCAASALKPAYQLAAESRPGFDRATAEHLKALAALESSGCVSMDQAADTFACLLQGISNEVSDPVKARILDQLFYHLGRWIYLVDALDDLKEDASSGNYNPISARFHLADGVLSTEARESLVVSLDNSVRLMAAAYELWDFGVWSPIITATLYEGLYQVGQSVLEGTFHAGSGKNTTAGKNKEQV